MYAMQIRSLCIESDKLLKKQLHDLNIIKSDDDVKLESKVESIHEPIEIAIEEDEDVKCEIVNTDDDVDDADGYESKDTDFEDNFIAPLPPPSLPQSSSKKTHEICHVCGKEYTKSYIATHLRTHLGEQKVKNFSCKSKLNFIKRLP